MVDLNDFSNENTFAAYKATTVSELIDVLSELDPDAPVMSTDPPFDHVNVIAQTNGKIIISS